MVCTDIGERGLVAFQQRLHPGWIGHAIVRCDHHRVDVFRHRRVPVTSSIPYTGSRPNLDRIKR
ncbi:hypothetical protein I551_0551 [Mycobacterium ulcerans str. Harvey]|uniref:Uncharacterized protein n=1 Tax=Mycobacterium ulcerans str. Harvey TaxID=1299332 RepID=A0ABP3AP37_MYCUL|nr:hypothetical protein I551_0551 [Mycobacterium ulcerans str. Harvey]